MTKPFVVCAGIPLPQEVVDRLRAEGFLPDLPQVAPVASPQPVSLTRAQERIWRALTDRPLNPRQRELLEIYWDAREEGAINVPEAGRRLAARIDLPGDDPIDFVKGSLRSFGKRLFKTHDMPARDVPLTTMLSIEETDGATSHRLTEDGTIAVEVALGLSRKDASDGAPVLLAMSPLSAALILRVQADLGCSIDAAIQAMTARMGAG